MAVAPIVASIAQVVGTKLLGDVMERWLMPDEIAPGAISERVRAGQRMLPMLEAEARGEITPGTQAQIRAMGEEVTRYKQSLGATARRTGMSGTIPTIAAQTRLEVGRIRGAADIRGRQQMAAQQSLMGLATGAIPMQRDIEMQRQAAFGSYIADIADIFKEERLKPEREAAERDSMWEDMLGSLRATLASFFGGMAGAGAPATGARPGATSAWGDILSGMR